MASTASARALAVLLMAIGLQGVRGSVSERVLGGAPTVVKVEDVPGGAPGEPAAETPTASAPNAEHSDAGAVKDEDVPEMLRTPPAAGESLVMCSGPQVCRGDTSLAGGVRSCTGGLSCKGLAVILMQDGGPKATPENTIWMPDPEPVAPDVAEAIPEEPVGSMKAELTAASAGGPQFEGSTVYVCSGKLICKNSFIRFGRLWCAGGYECVK